MVLLNYLKEVDDTVIIFCHFFFFLGGGIIEMSVKELECTEQLRYCSITIIHFNTFIHFYSVKTYKKKQDLFDKDNTHSIWSTNALV